MSSYNGIRDSQNTTPIKCLLLQEFKKLEGDCIGMYFKSVKFFPMGINCLILDNL